MVVERHRRETRTRKKHQRNQHRCHYQGYIRGDQNSNVALSACDGIVSFVFCVSFICTGTHYFNYCMKLNKYICNLGLDHTSKDILSNVKFSRTLYSRSTTVLNA